MYNNVRQAVKSNQSRIKVGSVYTTNKPLQSSFGSVLRPPFLVVSVHTWVWLLCSHLPKQTAPRTKTNPRWIQSNSTIDERKQPWITFFSWCWSLFFYRNWGGRLKLKVICLQKLVSFYKKNWRSVFKQLLNWVSFWNETVPQGCGHSRCLKTYSGACANVYWNQLTAPLSVQQETEQNWQTK